MAEITGGRNFFLGMQNTAEYTRDVSNMRLAVRRTDVAEIVKPFVEQRAAALVDAALGRIDVPQDLSLRVPAQLMDTYFGTPGPSERKMIEWTTIMFWYLFIDLRADPAIIARAETAAAECRAYLDSRIAERKQNPAHNDDILNRCLAMQAAGLPGMDDLCVRNNLIGLLIGAVPTTSKSAILALDQLLDRPEMLAGAQAAARAGDDALLAAHVFEALRFNPLSPIVYRRAIRDTVIARNTLRAAKIPKSTMVMAATLSAMFDPSRTRAPNAFRTDRDWNDYILWGYGLHTCFGAHINRVTIPGILKPLLKKPGLRRAAGPAGQIDSGGTPFPVHFVLEFDT
jgi:cytochrome P450